MKKSNYLHYLKEVDNKKGLIVSKTFKQSKKNTNCHNSRNSNPKTIEHGLLGRIDAFEGQKVMEKENRHPNFMKIKQNQLKPSEKPILRQQATPINYKRQQRIINNCLQSKEIQKQRLNHKFQQMSLTKCNFEAGHNNSNLFLIETQSKQQLIACQQCANKFIKRTPLSSFSQLNPKHSYRYLIRIFEQLQHKNKSLSRVKLIQKETISTTIDQVNAYYDFLIGVIAEKKRELESTLIQTYNQNEDLLDFCIQQNHEKIRLVNLAIGDWERKCAEGNYATQISSSDQIDTIANELSQYQHVELSCISQQIPIWILNDFQNDFTHSKYCISVNTQNQQKSEHQIPINKDDAIIQNEDQGHLSQQKDQNLNNASSPQLSQSPNPSNNKTTYNRDFQKELPFNVEYSQTSQKINFSHKLDDHLSKISSSEELLIDSLRDHRSYPKIYNHPSLPEIYVNRAETNLNMLQAINHHLESDMPGQNGSGKGPNFKTEQSTCRTCPQDNSQSRQHFVKHLHLDQEDFTDLMCDQDLTLSSSHPIHKNPLPRKSLKLSYNPTKHQPLTVSQLSSQLSQNRPLAEILNPSLISANENKHEISFELDENMLIDANILPTDELDQENLDIISPAFKII